MFRRLIVAVVAAAFLVTGLAAPAHAATVPANISGGSTSYTDNCSTIPNTAAELADCRSNIDFHMTWVVPNDGGDPITGYVAEVSTDGAAWTFVTMLPSTATSWTLTNADRIAAGIGDLYSVKTRVRAVNGIGEATGSGLIGGWDQSCTAYDSASSPDPCVFRRSAVEASALPTETTVNVTGIPYAGGLFPTVTALEFGYKAVGDPDSAAVVTDTQAVAGGTSVEVGGAFLPNRTTDYEVGVRAVSGGTTGPWFFGLWSASNWSSSGGGGGGPVATVPDDIPTLNPGPGMSFNCVGFPNPASAAALAACLSNITYEVTWTAPADGGSPLTGYIAEVSYDGQATWHLADTLPASATSYTSTYASRQTVGVPDLATFYVRVRAVNAVGEATGGTPGSMVLICTTGDTPGSPSPCLMADPASFAFTSPTRLTMAAVPYFGGDFPVVTDVDFAYKPAGAPDSDYVITDTQPVVAGQSMPVGEFTVPDRTQMWDLGMRAKAGAQVGPWSQAFTLAVVPPSGGGSGSSGGSSGPAPFTPPVTVTPTPETTPAPEPAPEVPVVDPDAPLDQWNVVGYTAVGYAKNVAKVGPKQARTLDQLLASVPADTSQLRIRVYGFAGLKATAQGTVAASTRRAQRAADYLTAGTTLPVDLGKEALGKKRAQRLFTQLSGQKVKFPHNRMVVVLVLAPKTP